MYLGGLNYSDIYVVTLLLYKQQTITVGHSIVHHTSLHHNIVPNISEEFPRSYILAANSTLWN